MWRFHPHYTRRDSGPQPDHGFAARIGSLKFPKGLIYGFVASTKGDGPGPSNSRGFVNPASRSQSLISSKL